MGQSSLSRVMAAAAIDAIVQRQHALLGEAQCATLRHELEYVIAAATYLLHRGAGASQQASVPQALERIAETIIHALHRSDHVEDIYAGDAAMQRDVAGALANALVEHRRTQPQQPAADHQTVVVHLDELGAAAAYLCRALTTAACQQVLREAGAGVGARLLHISPQTRSASFLFSQPTPSDAIALEDAVVSTLLRWVEEDRIEVPYIEQLLQWQRGQLDSEAAAAAMRYARDHARQHSGCLAHTVVLNAHTVRVRLVPLSQAAADGLDTHYDALLARLQLSLTAALASSAPTSAPESSARELTPRASEAAASPTSIRGADTAPASTQYPASSYHGSDSRPTSPAAVSAPPPSVASKRRSSSNTSRPTRRNRKTGG